MVLEIPSQLRVACYRATIEAIDPLKLPVYKGSTLRGGFGHVFRRTTCVQRRVRDCARCLLYSQCPYVYIFETPVPEDAKVLRSHDQVVRPFVIEPPLDGKTVYVPGDRLTFGLTLVGRAIQYLPYFVIVFEELGRRGLGRARGKYVLRQVEAVKPWNEEGRIVYSTGGELQRNADMALTADSIVAHADRLPPDRVTLNLLTPTRLKHGGRWMSEGPPFHVVIRTLLRRISSLSYFHCDEQWEIDYRGWIERAREVQLADSDVRWVAWERYSGRQKQRVPMGGLVGSVTYEGDVEPFRTLLALGQWVHVGKGTVFGNGQYVVGKGEKQGLRASRGVEGVAEVLAK